MTSENIKDLRNMADMLAKDYQRLADDMRAMRDCLNPIQVELAIMEEKKRKEEFIPGCENCRFWKLDQDDPSRRCRYCDDGDEWQAEEV
jgi:hypothetical protein